jgi:amino acid adenylation domain-containing protein
MAIGLVADRSADTLVAALAILTSGATCVPLDPAYPAERLRFMLGDSGVALVLTDNAKDRTWNGVPARMLDGTGERRAADGAATLPPDVAWLLYTSGSTGQPKGVRLGHGMIVARLLREPLAWEPDERCCHKTSLNFIDALWEMFGPLAHGLPTVVADRETARDPRRLAELLARGCVTRVVLVPSLLGAVLELGGPEQLAGVRRWICSGEPLTGTLAERFYTALPQARLINLYGTSECWDATWHEVPRDVRAGELVPVGQPLADVSAWLLDDGLNPVPPGVPGELFVGGPCVSQGYHDRPDLTAARFVPASWTGDADATAYRTGDIGRQRDDGALELLGRRDLQIKLRGFRIELEEVERRLLATSDVVEGAIAPARDADGTVVGLTAYVVAPPDSTFDAARARKELAERLPDHCIPSAFVQVARLPLTPNGKLDRAALPDLEPIGEADDGVAEHVEPRTPLERALATIWRDALGVERVGVTDSFFELGGHSLLAVQVSIRVEEELALTLPLRLLYAQPTIAELSAALDG